MTRRLVFVAVAFRADSERVALVLGIGDFGAASRK
jgi:hypothetical protein